MLLNVSSAEDNYLLISWIIWHSIYIYSINIYINSIYIYIFYLYIFYPYSIAIHSLHYFLNFEELKITVVVHNTIISKEYLLTTSI